MSEKSSDESPDRNNAQRFLTWMGHRHPDNYRADTPEQTRRYGVRKLLRNIGYVSAATIVVFGGKEIVTGDTDGPLTTAADAAQETIYDIPVLGDGIEAGVEALVERLGSYDTPHGTGPNEDPRLGPGAYAVEVGDQKRQDG